MVQVKVRLKAKIISKISAISTHAKPRGTQFPVSSDGCKYCGINRAVITPITNHSSFNILWQKLQILMKWSKRSFTIHVLNKFYFKITKLWLYVIIIQKWKVISKINILKFTVLSKLFFISSQNQFFSSSFNSLIKWFEPF